MYIKMLLKKTPQNIKMIEQPIVFHTLGGNQQLEFHKHHWNYSLYCEATVALDSLVGVHVLLSSQN